ncbi:MAG: hypothetical protein EXR55_00515 [Dehalococcoidia bacterium]|nr:hypothetical protein [Dehalococcoidia bacterium]
METVRLSATTLGSLNLPGFCPGCFWIRLRYKGAFPFQIPMSGIFISIDSYIKKLIHTPLDQGDDWPAWLPALGDVKAYVPRLHSLWFSCEDKDSGIQLAGTPDDVLRLEDGAYHIVDYKTAKVTKAQGALFPQYEVQLNAYAYIAEHLTQKEPLAPVMALSLVYLEPQTDIASDALVDVVSGAGFRLQFNVVVKPVELHPNDMIPPLLSRARSIIDSKEPLEHIAGCQDERLLKQLLALVQG